MFGFQIVGLHELEEKHFLSKERSGDWNSLVNEFNKVPYDEAIRFMNNVQSIRLDNTGSHRLALDSN